MDECKPLPAGSSAPRVSSLLGQSHAAPAPAPAQSTAAATIAGAARIVAGRCRLTQ